MFQSFALSCQLSEQQTSTKTQQKGGISAPSNNDYRGARNTTGAKVVIFSFHPTKKRRGRLPHTSPSW